MDSLLTKEERSHFLRRLKELENERKRGWEGRWKAVAKNFLPYHSRFIDAGERSNEGHVLTELQSGMGTIALRTLAAGMQSGLTSPARPWFRLDLTDKQMGDVGRIKQWIDETQERMVEVFRASNFYSQVHKLYEELCGFGTAVLLIEEDAKQVINCITLTAGEYCIDTGKDGRVDTLYRRVQMTPRQIEEEWPDTCPETVRKMVENDNNEWVTILHAIEPSKQHKNGSRRGNERPWRSVYMILEGAEQVCLEDSGYYEFPALCPRWQTIGSDIYGGSPAVDALADCRELQVAVEQARIATELEVNPPLVAQVGAFTGPIDASPGHINYASNMAPGQDVVAPLTTVRANLPGAERWIGKLEYIIQRHFHNDLFRMLMDAEKGQMTATEISARQGEKMILLGPVLDRLKSELFQPMVERVIGMMDRRGMVEFPPQEMAGHQVSIEFVSMLAQAQRLESAKAIDMMIRYVEQVAPMYPEIVDKFNFDEIADFLADIYGMPSKLMRSDEELEQIREFRKQQQQVQQMLSMAQQGAQVAATGSEAMNNLRPPELAMAQQGMGAVQ